MKTGMLLLGLALGILWLVGLSAHATPWTIWFDLAFGVLSVVTAVAPLPAGPSTGATGMEPSPTMLRAPPLVLSIGLLVLWIVALAVGATPFITWWTLAFAVAYGLLALLATRKVELPTTSFPGARRI